jgi:parallel beta-helix repeat protein
MRPIMTCLAVVLALPAAAQVVHQVPADFPTIQEAVDAAADGDTIEISGGTYEEAVLVGGKTSLLLRAKGKVVIAPPPASTGLTLANCTDCTVEKLRVAGGDPFGIFLQDSTGCALVKCRVQDSVEDGLRAEGGGGHVSEKCVVKDVGRDGLGMGTNEPTGVDGCTATKCKFLRPEDDGTDINGDDNTFDQCLVLKPAEDGFEVDDTADASGNVFTACKVVKPAQHGLFARGTGSANRFTGCKVIKAGVDAAHVEDGSAVRLEGCKLVKAGGNGVAVEPGADLAELLDNTVTGVGDDGFDVEGPDATITGNTVKACKDNGVKVGATGGSVADNKATGNKGDGFQIGIATGVTVDGNTAKGNKDSDLNDESGNANVIEPNNEFGTTSP